MDNYDLTEQQSNEQAWQEAMEQVMSEYDWDWSKHYPKRDKESWNILAGQFIDDYKTLMSNYNEEDGIPGTRNSEELMEVFQFLVKNPDLRFFQGLIALIRRDIYVMD